MIKEKMETSSASDSHKAEAVKAAHQRVFDTLNQLIEVVDEKFLCEKLHLLDTGTWDEIVEERYLSSLCGFPTCSESIHRPDSTGRRYKIDRREKKVYTAIPQYEKFCSSKCYEHSLHLQHQLHEQPLWFDVDRPKREYTLELPKNGHQSRRVEDIFVEETDKLLLTRLNEMKIADNEELSGEESDGEEEDDKVNPKKQKEDDKFLSEIRSFVTSVGQMTSKSTANTMGLTPTVGTQKSTNKKANEPIAVDKKESLSQGEINGEKLTQSPTTNQAKSPKPNSPQFSKQEMEEKLARLRAKYNGKKNQPQTKLIDALQMDPEKAKKLPENMR